MKENPFTPSDEQINEAVKRSKNKAEKYLHDADKTRELVEDAVKKADEREPNSRMGKDFWTQLKALIRMLKAYVNRQYTVVPWASIVMVAAAVLYFVSPIDLILDWIPLAGFVDDAAVLVFVIRQIQIDLEKFQQWEASRDEPGKQVIDL
jgi:uncharacterized membrane protein YkvA (DUF1232 family)